MIKKLIFILLAASLYSCSTTVKQGKYAGFYKQRPSKGYADFTKNYGGYGTYKK